MFNLIVCTCLYIFLSLFLLCLTILASKMNMEEHKRLHIVMFPWLAFGHMIPFLELSKQLATKGHHIYFVSTPRNLERLPKIPQNLTPFITLVPLPLPRVENLPQNAEATSDVGFEKGVDLLKKAYDGLQEPMTQFLKGFTVSSNVVLDWIIYDFSCYWLPPIADKFKIGKVFFNIVSARFLSMLGPLTQENGETNLWSSPEMLTSPPPWIPFENSTVYFLPHEARMVFQGATQKTSSGVSDVFRVQTCVSSCDLAVVRSSIELEGEYVQLMEKLNQKTVVPVGLLPPSVSESQEDATSNPIIEWLDKQRIGSVMYVALGSEVVPSQDQLSELAHGLELSGVPFLWAFRTSVVSSLVLPERFEERTQDRGLVWKSWAPQHRILSHDSVGGFLTHAGWGSVVETLTFGKPLVMLPLAIDQGLNSRFMTEMKVGIEIPRNEDNGSFTRKSVVESLTLVLQDEATGNNMYINKAKKIAEILANENLQRQYIENFSNHLYDHKSTTEGLTRAI